MIDGSRDMELEDTKTHLKTCSKEYHQASTTFIKANKEKALETELPQPEQQCQDRSL